MDELHAFEDLIINTAIPTNPDPQGGKHHNIENHNIENQNTTHQNTTQLNPECKDDDSGVHQIIIFNPTDQTQHNIGKHLYQKNNALRNFANVMEHPEFSTFINEYLFRDPAAVIKLMKLYANIGQTIKDPYEKLAVFNAQMRDYMRSGKPTSYLTTQTAAQQSVLQ
jgi:hypothetical protein